MIFLFNASFKFSIVSLKSPKFCILWLFSLTRGRPAVTLCHYARGFQRKPQAGQSGLGLLQWPALQHALGVVQFSARRANHGPWHVICVLEGSGFVTDSSLQENFHVVTQHHCAVLLNKDTFEYDISCTACLIPCSLRYASWALEGMAVTSKFRRAPDQSCSYFTIANIPFNNECAERRSVCVELLLLPQARCGSTQR